MVGYAGGTTTLMAPRTTDWSLALAVGAAFATGVLSLVSGRPADWWVFALHGIIGLWLLPLVIWKLRRVKPRLLHPRAWDKRTWFALAATLLVLLALTTGILWVAGVEFVLAGYHLLNWHIVFGIVLVVATSAHMLARARPMRIREIRDRRTILRWGLVLVGAALTWNVQQVGQRVLGWRGAERRFTGSYERASYTGNAFPTVSWVADRPQPIAPDDWRLAITGAVAQPQTLTRADLLAWDDELDVILDCTGGFYSAQIWRGVLVGRLLEQAVPTDAARFVSFVSVTGYRWSLPLAEARSALLATHLGGEPVSHGHGAPARLVAPGRRGFEWVKWVVELRVLTAPDDGQLAAIYTSSLSSGQ
ncbi:MAG: molybdopterin-dependent oxidoreductase [Chloroflexaceae bacterium]|nr:molybdopterin-dependent oxidoreductase [Chloroflexaceae bacterium]